MLLHVALLFLGAADQHFSYSSFVTFRNLHTFKTIGSQINQSHSNMPTTTSPQVSNTKVYCLYLLNTRSLVQDLL